MSRRLFRATIDEEKFSFDELAEGIDHFADVLEQRLAEAGATDIDLRVPVASEEEVLFAAAYKSLDRALFESILHGVAGENHIELHEIEAPES